MYTVLRAFEDNSIRTVTYYHVNEVLMCSYQMLEPIGISYYYSF